MYEIDENEKLVPLFEDKMIIRRQDLPKLYALNGAVYMAKTKYILSYKSFIGKDTIHFNMSKFNAIDIDDNLDLEVCEKRLK